MHPDQEGRAAAATPEPNAGGRHHAEDGADRHPLIDLDRDPTPGVADHAAPDDE
ncbi:MAG: hypothetical protein ACJ72N_06440 [Labedaea sp.]